MQLGQPQQGFVLTSVEQTSYCGYIWHFPDVGFYNVDSTIDNEVYGLLSNLVDAWLTIIRLVIFLSAGLLHDVVISVW